MEVPASTSKLDNSVATLASLTLEPSWLYQVYEGQADSSDKEMAKLVAWAWGGDARFSICSIFGLELGYRHPKPN